MPVDNSAYFLILNGTALPALGALFAAFYFYH
jgi:hypothetical protein